MMKKITFILFFVLFSVSCVFSQKTNVKKEVLVTKSMATKIADECLLGRGYALAVFYESNSEYLTMEDIAHGKGREILNELEKHPKYAENFIRKVYKNWGYNGLKQLRFNDTEITKAKKIINKLKKE